MNEIELNKIIFLVLAVAYIVITLKINSNKKKRMKEIKEGVNSKITLTSEVLISGYRTEIILIIMQMIIFLIFYIPFVLMINSINNPNTVGIIALIVIFLCFIGFPLFNMRKKMNYVKAIDNGNYYVEEDILIKKESSYYDKKTSYYIQLKNEKKLIRVTKKNLILQKQEINTIKYMVEK